MSTIMIKNQKELQDTITDEEVNVFLKQFAKNELVNKNFLIQITDEFAKIEKQEKKVTDIVMNAVLYADFRKLKEVDPNTSRQLLMRGLMAYIWEARLWVQKSCSDNEIKLYSDLKSLKEDFPTIQYEEST
jgi:preprotein translocase subunit SecF